MIKSSEAEEKINEKKLEKAEIKNNFDKAKDEIINIERSVQAELVPETVAVPEVPDVVADLIEEAKTQLQVSESAFETKQAGKAYKELKGAEFMANSAEKVLDSLSGDFEIKEKAEKIEKSAEKADRDAEKEVKERVDDIKEKLSKAEEKAVEVAEPKDKADLAKEFKETRDRLDGAEKKIKDDVRNKPAEEAGPEVAAELADVKDKIDKVEEKAREKIKGKEIDDVVQELASAKDKADKAEDKIIEKAARAEENKDKVDKAFKEIETPLSVTDVLNELSKVKRDADEDKAKRIKDAEDFSVDYEAAKEKLDKEHPGKKDAFEKEYAQSKKVLEINEKLDADNAKELKELREDLKAETKDEAKAEKEAEKLLKKSAADEFRKAYGEEFLPPGISLKHEGDKENGKLDEKFEAKEAGHVKGYKYKDDAATGYEYEFTSDGYKFKTPRGNEYEVKYDSDFVPPDGYETGNEMHKFKAKTLKGKAEYIFVPTGYKVKTKSKEKAGAYDVGEYEVNGGGKIKIRPTGYSLEKDGKVKAEKEKAVKEKKEKVKSEKKEKDEKAKEERVAKEKKIKLEKEAKIKAVKEKSETAKEKKEREVKEKKVKGENEKRDKKLKEEKIKKEKEDKDKKEKEVKEKKAKKEKEEKKVKEEKIVKYKYNPKSKKYVSAGGRVFVPPQGASLHEQAKYLPDKNVYELKVNGDVWTYDPVTDAWTSKSGEADQDVTPAILVDFGVDDVSRPGVTSPQAATASVKNIGTATATAVHYKYEIVAANGAVKYSTTGDITAVPSDSSVLVRTATDSGLSPGAYKLKFTVDSDGKFDEGDENDNVFEKELIVA
ncbi:MAG: hypothetical protein HYT16_02525 [DPANN group archaeon]|nr:hypothetical protein [DPANN group archaeon]